MYRAQGYNPLSLVTLKTRISLGGFTWTGVSALVVNASQGVGTFGVNGALGSAGWRRADVALKADAGSHLVEGSAPGVGTAGVVETRVNWPAFSGGDWNCGEEISGVDQLTVGCLAYCKA